MQIQEKLREYSKPTETLIISNVVAKVYVTKTIEQTKENCKTQIGPAKSIAKPLRKQNKP